MCIYSWTVSIIDPLFLANIGAPAQGAYQGMSVLLVQTGISNEYWSDLEVDPPISYSSATVSTQDGEHSNIPNGHNDRGVTTKYALYPKKHPNKSGITTVVNIFMLKIEWEVVAGCVLNPSTSIHSSLENQPCKRSLNRQFNRVQVNVYTRHCVST